MSRRSIPILAAGLAALAAVLLIAALASRSPTGPTPPERSEEPGTLYGRVTATSGVVYEGPLRWGGDEEAFWDHTFNGTKPDNPWRDVVPTGQRDASSARRTVFGVELPWDESGDDLRRPVMVRFGDIGRIEARGEGAQSALTEGVDYQPEVRVTLKSGSVLVLDRLAASDFDDGVRVWDPQRGTVDLGPRAIRSVEFLAAPAGHPVPARLYGTVHTSEGSFTGFLQWNRDLALAQDVLVGRDDDGERQLRFSALRSVIRQPEGGATATTRRGEVVPLAHVQATQGIYVDDPRIGRVLVSWAAVQRVDLGTGGASPAYPDFAPGRPLVGRVVTRDGRRLAGRLVIDLDESETTETLDAPAGGVDYSLPLGQVALVDLTRSERARVTLRTGTVLTLRRAGDLGAGNAGVLVWTAGRERPDYVPWSDVRRLELDPDPRDGT